VSIRRFIFFLSLALLTQASAQRPSPSASASPAASPTATPVPDSQMPIWRCELPGGIYEVAIRAIVSVSSHEFVVDGAARVTEVNVDTSGNNAVRFYYIEPNTPSAPDGLGQSAIDRIADLAKEAAGRTGQDDIWKRVVKSYPTTTHSHTVEYRLQSEDQLKKVFASADLAFRTGRSANVKFQ
jgi:hypothetical protein